MAELTCKTHSVETKSSPCANSILPHTAPHLIKKGCRSDSNDFTRYHQVIQLVPHIMGKYSFILWESIPTIYGTNGVTIQRGKYYKDPDKSRRVKRKMKK